MTRVASHLRLLHVDCVCAGILRVNGQAEIYAFVEQIDDRFTRSRFTEGGKGNLYKDATTQRVWALRQLG